MIYRVEIPRELYGSVGRELTPHTDAYDAERFMNAVAGKQGRAKTCPWWFRILSGRNYWIRGGKWAWTVDIMADRFYFWTTKRKIALRLQARFGDVDC